jgi:hypothetical protein
MLATAILAGTLTVVTIPDNVQRRLSSTYPTWAVRQELSSATLMEAIVEPDGKVRSCRVVEFVGNERLAAEECAALSRRKLRPAMGPDGRPILGAFRTNIRRYLHGDSAEIRAVRAWTPPPDLTVQLSRDSSGGEVRHDVDVAVLVEADGAVTMCDGIAEANERAEVPAELVAVACTEAMKLRGPSLTSPDGTPTAYVANMKIRLERGSAT